MGLVGSHCMPPVLSHWPDQSGYLVSSCAQAAASKNIAASATTAIDLGHHLVLQRRGWVGSTAAKNNGASLADHDRPPVLELGLAHGPSAAGRATAQRFYRQLELVTGFQSVARPAVPGQCARRGALQGPHLRRAVFLLDREEDGGMRAGELELLHQAFELDRILLIEHGERVMRQDGAARRDERAACQHNQLLSHGFFPVLPRLHAPYRNAVKIQWLSLGQKKQRPSRLNTCRMASMSLPVAITEIPAHPVFAAARGRV